MPQKVWLRCKEALDRALDPAAVRVVFDVGARDCNESADFARAYPAATVYAFECNPATLPQCRAVMASEPRVVLTEKAASDQNGRLAFFPTNPERTQTGIAGGNPGASSLFEASGAYPEECYVQDRVEVETIRLDEFCAARGITEIDVLWMDVQGAELLVLRNALKALSGALLIQAEVEFVELYRGQPMFADVDSFLRSQGFQFHAFNGFSGRAFKPLVANNDPNAGVRQVLWSDALYVRDWMRLPALDELKLMKYAVLAHDVLQSCDLAHVVLTALDGKTGGDFAQRYLERLVQGDKP